MHSFHRTRGRIVLEICCALAMAASFAVAWIQTYASAFLPASAVAAFYSLLLATDLRQRPAPVVSDAAIVEADETEQPRVSAPATTEAVAAVEDAKATPKPKKRSRKKPAAETAKAVEPVASEPQPVEPEPMTPTVVLVEPDATEDDYHPPVAPLFEPQPLVRQQRMVFGRKAG